MPEVGEARAPTHAKEGILYTNVMKTRTSPVVAPGAALRSKGCLNVWAGTWNVGGMEPSHIAEMLRNDYPHDVRVGLCVIGLQGVMLPPPVVQAAVPRDAVSENGIAWESALDAYFEEQRPHMKKMCAVRVGGTMLCVYVLREYAAFVSELSSGSISFGWPGVGRDKGALGASFKTNRGTANEKTVCLVCAHLCAGGEPRKLQERVAELAYIHANLKFPSPWARETKAHVHIADHSHVILLGDLNFRLARQPASLPRKEDPLQEAGIVAMRRTDELLHAMAFHHTLVGYSEGRLDFKPTYKYATKNNMYDPTSDSGPAWTDRILWRAKGVILLQYTTKRVVGSDHKPVHALLSLRSMLGG